MACLDKKVYGNINLMALKGATIIQDNAGREGIFIPIDIADIKRSKGKYYLSFLIFPFKKYWYQYMVVQSLPKEQRDQDKKPIILGNATNVTSQPGQEPAKKAPGGNGGNNNDDFVY